MSVCATPMVAAKSAVSVPIIATTISANGARSKMMCDRATHHQQQTDGGQQSSPSLFHFHSRNVPKHLLEIKRSKMLDHQEKADQKAEVADTVNDEGFFAGGGGRILGEPETDQEVRSQPYTLPADKHQQVIVG